MRTTTTRRWGPVGWFNELAPAGGMPVRRIAPTSATSRRVAVGARAWARQRSAERGIAINCDGVDDTGALTIMYSGMPSIEIIDAIRAATDEPAQVRRMPLGLLLDSVALTESGWRAVTVSRGSLASLRRVHTRSDSLQQLRGDGISRTASVLARATEALAR